MKLSTALLAGSLLFVGSPALAEDDDYIHCTLKDGTHDTAYYSEVFLGDYSHSTRYSNAFSAHVHANYDNVIGTASCFYEDDRSAARAERDRMKASARGIYDNIIDTGWVY
jgi:hypothetical protein